MSVGLLQAFPGHQERQNTVHRRGEQGGRRSGEDGQDAHRRQRSTACQDHDGQTPVCHHPDPVGDGHQPDPGHPVRDHPTDQDEQQLRQRLAGQHQRQPPRARTGQRQDCERERHAREAVAQNRDDPRRDEQYELVVAPERRRTRGNRHSGRPYDCRGGVLALLTGQVRKHCPAATERDCGLLLAPVSPDGHAAAPNSHSWCGRSQGCLPAGPAPGVVHLLSGPPPALAAPRPAVTA